MRSSGLWFSRRTPESVAPCAGLCYPASARCASGGRHHSLRKLCAACRLVAVPADCAAHWAGSGASVMGVVFESMCS